MKALTPEEFARKVGGLMQTATHASEEEISPLIAARDEEIRQDYAAEVQARLAQVLGEHDAGNEVLVRQARHAALTEAERVVREMANNYPTDIFGEPPPGEHGETVDACSARMARHCATAWADAIRRLREGKP